MINRKSLTRGLLLLPLVFGQPVMPVLPVLAAEQASSAGAVSSGANAPKAEFKLSTYFSKAQLTQKQLEEAIAATEKLAQTQVDKGVVPGLAIAVVHNDKLIYAKGFGIRQAGKSEQVVRTRYFNWHQFQRPLVRQ